MDPMDFLVEHAPFSELSPSGREALSRHLEITYIRAGDTILSREGTNTYLWAVRKGWVRLEIDGQRVDDIGPGEIFGITAMSGEDRPSLDAIAETDCLFHRFHRDAVRALFGRETRFASFFLQNLTARLQALAEGSPVALSGDLRIPVGQLVTRPPVVIGIDASVREAARHMDEERVSSVLVVDDERPGARQLIGILTDRDLRGRVLAVGKGPETPVREVMSSPVEMVDAEATASEALLRLLRNGLHHLPIERRDQVVGVVTHADLLRHQRHGPGALLKMIEKARDVDSLSRYAENVGSMVDSLNRNRVDATDIGRLVAALNDAMVSHLLSLAQQSLGPLPCDYAWIVFGSEGRQEQSFLTDQDNALIYADDTPEAREYFEALARAGVDSLVKVGFPPCAGGFMATNWCDSLATWRDRFEGWMSRPEPEALMKVANFFDFRRVHGALELDALEEPIAGAGKRRAFIAHLARAAMEMRPPLGLLHGIRESPAGVDLKAGALMPIVGLARVFALEAGERDGSTLHRLRAAVKAKVVSLEGAELLAESFRFAFGLRLRTQLAARRAGSPVSHRVHLDDLTPGERRHLKEAFLAVHRMQNATASRLGVDRLG